MRAPFALVRRFSRQPATSATEVALVAGPFIEIAQACREAVGVMWHDEYGDVCTPALWVHRALLVLSNLPFLLAVFECVLRIRASRIGRFLSRPLKTAAVGDDDDDQAGYRAIVIPVSGAPASDTVSNAAAGDSSPSGRRAAAEFCPACCGTVGHLLAIDIAFCVALTLASATYHFCMDDADCTRECLVDWRDLKGADFVLSFTIISVVVFHTADVNAPANQGPFLFVWKHMGVLWSFSANILYVCFATLEHSVELPYVGGALAWYAVMWLVRAVFAKSQLIDEVRRTRWPYIGLSVASCVAGFYVQHLTEGGAEDLAYWWQHSLWHVLQALAIWARFRAAPHPKQNQTEQHQNAPSIVNPSLQVI